MKTRIIRIGNSQGIRIPKPILDQSGLSGEVELEAYNQTITIRPVEHVRGQWEQAFREMAQQGDDRLIDPDLTGTGVWDQDEWEW